MLFGARPSLCRALSSKLPACRIPSTLITIPHSSHICLASVLRVILCPLSLERIVLVLLSTWADRTHSSRLRMLCLFHEMTGCNPLSVFLPGKKVRDSEARCYELLLIEVHSTTRPSILRSAHKPLSTRSRGVSLVSRTIGNPRRTLYRKNSSRQFSVRRFNTIHILQSQRGAGSTNTEWTAMLSWNGALETQRRSITLGSTYRLLMIHLKMQYSADQMRSVMAYSKRKGDDWIVAR